MVTLVKNAVFMNIDHLEGEQEFRGLSTDTKPTDAINGAAFVEIDTGKVFLFDATGIEWYEM